MQSHCGMYVEVYGIICTDKSVVYRVADKKNVLNNKECQEMKKEKRVADNRQ